MSAYATATWCTADRASSHRGLSSLRGFISHEYGRGLESLDDGVDAEGQLPENFRDRHDDLRRGLSLDDVKEHGDPRDAHQGAADEPEYGQASWHQARPVHQVAEYQPVPYPDNESRPRSRTTCTARVT